MQPLEELKQLAAVMEGLAHKLVGEREYLEARQIGQTLMDYGRSFEQVYIKMLANETTSDLVGESSSSTNIITGERMSV